jgi:hypothetical protein
MCDHRPFFNSLMPSDTHSEALGWQVICSRLWREINVSPSSYRHKTWFLLLNFDAMWKCGVYHLLLLLDICIVGQGSRHRSVCHLILWHSFVLWRQMWWQEQNMQYRIRKTVDIKKKIMGKYLGSLTKWRIKWVVLYVTADMNRPRHAEEIQVWYMENIS